MSKQLATHFNEQNRALLENANLIKQKAGEGTFEVNHVGNATRSIEAYQEIQKDTRSGIKQAYQDLEKLGAGKIEIDSKTFGNNAMKALSEKEDIDFLPPTIRSKVEQYQNGKPLNFDQLDNFITQTSREIRKAQRAGDGNAVHALTLVRGEIEKLPLLNETAAAKVVADKARSLAAKEFGLLDKTKPTYNSVYADIVNGVADSKDFIPKTIFGTKNKQFGKALDLIADKPEAKQQLKAGTLDYMIRKSTDASGNFNTGKFREFVDNLEVNDKGAPLFGDDWQSLKNLAKTGQLIEARPRGSFVNESNSTVAALAKYAKTAAETGVNIAAKGLPVGTIGRNFLESRAAAKEVKESLKPGAGIKLKDIGKE
jgi:transcriptional regulator NrdR family protein